MQCRSFLLATLFGTASAFTPRQMLNRHSRLLSWKAQMSGDVDTMCIMNAAELCSLESGYCDPEEEEALWNRLESQAHALEVRLEEMRSLVFALTERPRLAVLDTHHFSGVVLDEMDTMCLFNTAQYCVDEGCTFEDKEALMNRLHEQYTAWNLRLLEILSTMKRLDSHMHRMSYVMRRPEVDSLMQSIEAALTMDYKGNNNKVPIGSFD